MSLEDDATIADALDMLDVLRRRWPEVEAAKQASERIEGLRSSDEKPWEAYQTQQRLNESKSLAEAYEAAARITSGMTAAERAMLAYSAISHFEVVKRDSDDRESVQNAVQRIDALRPLAEKLPIVRKPRRAPEP